MQMSDIKIFGPRVSSFVNKVLAAADYKQLDYAHQEYMSIKELARMSPVQKKVPIAIFDGEVVLDSTRILQRFDQMSADRRLISPVPALALQQRFLEDWADETLYWFMMAIRWSPSNEHRAVKQNSAFVPAVVRPFAGPILRKLVGGQAKAQGMGRLSEAELFEEFGKRLDDLVELLGDKPFFTSDTPSIVDFAVYGPFCTGCNDDVTPDFNAEVRKRPALVAWRKRLELEMGPRRARVV